MQVSKKFGEKLCKRREHLGHTQVIVAARVGITRVYLARIERGGLKVSKPVMACLFRELGLARFIFDLVWERRVNPDRMTIRDDGGIEAPEIGKSAPHVTDNPDTLLGPFEWKCVHLLQRMDGGRQYTAWLVLESLARLPAGVEG